MLNKLFSQNKLKTEWSFSQNGNLWRFYYGGDDVIIGETRDIEKKSVYFFSINSRTGKPYFKNYSFEEEDFWISLDAAHPKMFFLHRFERPELPYPKSIIAVDILTGKKLWENEEYSYFFNTNDRLIVFKQKFETVCFADLNFENGNVEKLHTELENQNIYQFRESVNAQDFSEKYDYPGFYDSDAETDANISSLIQKETPGIRTEGEIEYLKKNKYLILNYYLNKGIDIRDISRKKLENRFAIFDTISKEKVFSETLYENSPYPVPDNFFYKNNFILFIKEKKELSAIKLPE